MAQIVKIALCQKEKCNRDGDGKEKITWRNMLKNGEVHEIERILPAMSAMILRDWLSPITVREITV